MGGIDKQNFIDEGILLHNISSSDYFDRFKRVVDILLTDKKFLENDLRYMSVLSNHKYVAIVSYEKEIFNMKYISPKLLNIISHNGLISDINSDNFMKFLYYSINNPGKEIYTNITINDKAKYLNIIYSKDNNDFELYFIDHSVHDSFIMTSIVRDMNMINHILGIRDSETQEHTFRVGEMSYYLATLMGLNPSFSDNIKIAAMLHDIGKIKIPDYLLLKEGKIEGEEYEIVKMHTTFGGEIIDKLGFVFNDPELIDFIKNITNMHHEKYDGSGYPYGLVGQDIPLEARIVTVIDVFDALKSKRPYKEAYYDEEVKKIMLAQKGIDFDPDVLDIFISHYYEFTGIRGVNEDTDTNFQYSTKK